MLAELWITFTRLYWFRLIKALLWRWLPSSLGEFRLNFSSWPLLFEFLPSSSYDLMLCRPFKLRKLRVLAVPTDILDGCNKPLLLLDGSSGGSWLKSELSTRPLIFSRPESGIKWRSVPCSALSFSEVLLLYSRWLCDIVLLEALTRSRLASSLERIFSSSKL